MQGKLPCFELFWEPVPHHFDCCATLQLDQNSFVNIGIALGEVLGVGNLGDEGVETSSGHLKYLDLRGNTVSQTASESLMRGLAANTSLEFLLLTQCGEAAQMNLAASLYYNRSLRYRVSSCIAIACELCLTNFIGT